MLLRSASRSEEDRSSLTDGQLVPQTRRYSYAVCCPRQPSAVIIFLLLDCMKRKYCYYCYCLGGSLYYTPWSGFRSGSYGTRFLTLMSWNDS